MWLIEFTNKRPDNAIQKAINATVDSAKSKWGLKFEGEYPTTGIGVTTLRPFHVEENSLPNASAHNSWYFAITTAWTWQDWVNAEINKNLYVIHAGIFDITTSPALTEFSAQANGTDLPIQNIESIYSYERPLGWWSKPFIVAPENNLTARAYGNAAQTENAGFLGFGVGKRNILIDAS